MKTMDEAGSGRFWRRDSAHVRSASGANPWQTVLDAGVAASLIGAPLILGGRHPWGRLLLVTLIGLTVSVWAFRQVLAPAAGWVRPRGLWLYLAGLLLLVLQLTPMSTPWLSQLAPGITEVLPLWDGEAISLRHATWRTLSLAPEATRQAIAMYLAYGMLYFVITQRVRRLRDVETILRFVALGGVFMATCGIVQYLAGNGRFLWVYAHPSRDTWDAVKGPFPNQNHFAHYLALSLGAVLWWVLQPVDQPSGTGQHAWLRGGSQRPDVRRQLRWLGVALVALAGLLTYSRGGLFAMFVAGTVYVAVVDIRRLRPRGALAAVALAGLLVAALALHGLEPLTRRLGTLTTARSIAELSPSRYQLWSALWRSSADFPWFGCGVGALRDFYPRHLEQQFGVEFTHGEQGYLQLLVETGWVGLALFLSGLATLATMCRRALRHTSGRTRAAVAAAIAALAASIVHAFFDFVWYIPACMALTVTCTALIARVSSWTRSADRDCERQGESPVPSNDFRGAARHDWILAAAACVGLTIVLFQTCLPPALAARHWDAYLRLSLTAEREPPASEAAEQALLRDMEQQLQQAVTLDNGDGRAHLRLTNVQLRQFELAQRHATNAMELTQIRDAALTSPFADHSQLRQWLDVAVGTNRRRLDLALQHARRGVQLTPLQGEAYVMLLDLAFLERAPLAEHDALLRQALCLRPHDGRVLFVAGREAVLHGNLAAALDFWRRAFRQDRRLQPLIIAALGDRMPAAEFLRWLQPDLGGLAQLYRFYRKQNLAAEAAVVARPYLQALQAAARDGDSSSAVRYWSQAADVQIQIADWPGAVRSLQEALTLAPAEYSLHRRLAEALCQTGRWPEATAEIEWCLQRRPDDPALQRRLAETRQPGLSKNSTHPRVAR